MDLQRLMGVASVTLSSVLLPALLQAEDARAMATEKGFGVPEDVPTCWIPQIIPQRGHW